MTREQDQRHIAELMQAAKRRHVDPRLVDEARHSATLAYVIKHDLPLTREEWIAMNWPDGKPKPWTAEHEMEVPAVWRDHDED